MIKIVSKSGSACEVQTKNTTFAVFPEEPAASGYSLMSHPSEGFQKTVVSWPGEYDFGGMFIRGIGQEEGKQVSYICDAEGVRLAFIDAPVLPWTDADLEKLGNIAVLLIRADDGKNVKSLVEAVDPRILILVAEKNSDVAAIAKSTGASDMETVSELKIQSSSLPADTRKTVILG